MKQMSKRLIALILCVIMSLQICLAIPAGAVAVELPMADKAVRQDSITTLAGASAVIDSDTVWSYLDDGTDPAGDSDDRTSWTKLDYNDSEWKTGSGTFGSKRGGADLGGGFTASTILDGCDGSNDTPA